MNAKEKMQALIDQKKQDGKHSVNKNAIARNDHKNMRKGPKIYNKW